MATRAPRLVAIPLAAWERDGVAAALAKTGLPTGDINESSRLFWRFQQDDMPVGFGGLDFHGDAALMHSIVTLPPLRRRGIGRAIVAALEAEIPHHTCHNIFLLTAEPEFFAQLGYVRTSRETVPKAIQTAPQFATPATSMTVMMKRLS